MSGWKLWFVLLLLRTFCTDSQELIAVTGVQLMKTIGREPDVTPVCPNETLQTITLIVCKISTERSRGEECNLTYLYGHDFEHGCDSRFSLIKANQTVFLHLSNLTPNDSGNYTCQCSYPEGTYTLNLNITVEDDEDATIITTSSPDTSFFFIVTGVMIFIILFLLTVGFICRKMCSRQNTSGAPQPARCEALQSLEQDDTYTSLQRPDNDVYHSVAINHPRHNTDFRSACTDTAAVYTNSQEAHGKENDFDSGHAVYDTIQN